MSLNIGWLEVLLIDGAALITIVSFVFLLFKNRQDKLEARFQRHDDRITDLSTACIRREELSAIVEPINHQLSEIRHRIDNLLNT